MWLIQNKFGNEHKFFASAKTEVCVIKCGSRLGCLDATYNVVLNTGVGSEVEKVIGFCLVVIRQNSEQSQRNSTAPERQVPQR